MKTHYGRRRGCWFCKKKIEEISWEDPALFSRYLSPWGKIKAGSETGACAKHQRQLTRAIKNARQMGLLAYVNK